MAQPPEPAPVEIWLAGVRRTGTGQARGDEHTGVSVEIELDGTGASVQPR